MDLENSKICIIGGGMMAENILRGLLRSQLLQPDQIAVSDINAERLTYIRDTYKVATSLDNADQPDDGPVNDGKKGQQAAMPAEYKSKGDKIKPHGRMSGNKRTVAAALIGYRESRGKGGLSAESRDVGGSGTSPMVFQHHIDDKAGADRQHQQKINDRFGRQSATCLF